MEKRYTYHSGEIWEGPLDKLGRPDGEGKITGKDFTYTGTCEAGLPFGQGELVADYYRYKGGWNIFPEGYGELQYHLRQLHYEGSWWWGLLHGAGVMRWEIEDKVYEGRFDEGKIESFVDRLLYPKLPAEWPYGLSGHKKPVFDPWLSHRLIPT